ncbi:MAG TPA: triple tyrosine motif-containing protein, partial [Blastocatellia bacterium]|nr:triple tyrosine motif-containing protein [Blastocatellia bacterium]
APGNILAAFRDRTGAIWVGTHRGLSRFAPAPPETTPPPPILITGLNVAGERRSVSARGETEIALADLDPDRNQLQIDFVALGFAPGEVLRYQYRLKGSEDDWGALSEQRTVNYASLAPGRYRFLARAVNSDGVVSSNPATVTFTILRPVWQRWWFIALLTALLGLMGAALYRYRVARLIELERVRTRIATDLHDDIGAGLSRVAILSEVVKQQVSGKAEQSVPMLTEIADSARGLVEAMREIVWAIDPRRDELSTVVSRVRQFASDMLEAKGISWDFKVPPELEQIKLGPEQRRHLFLIFKEGLNNIARHADCQSVSMSLTLARQQLWGEIRDDGRGFPARNGTGSAEEPTFSANGHGHENMRQRASQVGGQVWIDSALGEGVRIKLMIPLKKR